MHWAYYIAMGIGGLIALSGMRVVRPVERGVVERLGKFIGIYDQGFHWVIPFIDRMNKVNITEQMIDTDRQTVITQDKLNTVVDAVVYYKVKDVKASLYQVDDHRHQLASLARTTLRAVIGKMTLTEANEKRGQINTQIEEVLDKETKSYGVEVLRVEIQKIDPPKDVQESMNNVVKAEQEKIAAKDLATAVETKADGEKRAKIKEAEGAKQFAILKAEGEAIAVKQVAEAQAKKIELVNTAIREHFKDQAVEYKQLETVENALKKGSKYVIDPSTKITAVLSEMAGVTPIKGE